MRGSEALKKADEVVPCVLRKAPVRLPRRLRLAPVVFDGGCQALGTAVVEEDAAQVEAYEAGCAPLRRCSAGGANVGELRAHIVEQEVGVGQE